MLDHFSLSQKLRVLGCITIAVGVVWIVGEDVFTYFLENPQSGLFMIAGFLLLLSVIVGWYQNKITERKEIQAKHDKMFAEANDVAKYNIKIGLAKHGYAYMNCREKYARSSEEHRHAMCMNHANNYR